MDAKQRPLTVSQPGLLPVAFTWDARGRPLTVTQGTRSQTLAWGTNGHLASVRNALGEVTAFTTDATGRVTKATQPDAKDVLVAQDGVGNLTSLTPADRQAHRFTVSFRQACVKAERRSG